MKNFGMWIKYNSRSGTHNMYREYRDTNLNSAIDTLCKYFKLFLSCIRTQSFIDAFPSKYSLNYLLPLSLYYHIIASDPLHLPLTSIFHFSLDNDMAGRHRSRNKSIQIIRTATVAAKDCKRVTTTQFHVSYLLLTGFVCDWMTSEVSWSSMSVARTFQSHTRWIE